MTCKYGYKWCLGWRDWTPGQIRPCRECAREMKELIAKQDDEIQRLRAALRLIVDCEDAADCLTIASRALLKTGK